MKPAPSGTIFPALQIDLFQLVGVGDFSRRRDHIERGMDVVRRLVHVISSARKLADLPEQRRIALSHNPNRFQVARAGRLYMEPPMRRPGQGGIDRKLVRAGMQAQLIRPKQLGNRIVVANRLLERGHVADVVDALLQRADKPRRERHQLHSPLQALIGNDIVLG